MRIRVRFTSRRRGMANDVTWWISNVYGLDGKAVYKKEKKKAICEKRNY